MPKQKNSIGLYGALRCHHQFVCVCHVMQAEQQRPPRTPFTDGVLAAIRTILWPIEVLLRFVDYAVSAISNILIIATVLFAVAYVAYLFAMTS